MLTLAQLVLSAMLPSVWANGRLACVSSRRRPLRNVTTTLPDSLGAKLLVIGEGGRGGTRHRCAVGRLRHSVLVVIVLRRA